VKNESKGAYGKTEEVMSQEMGEGRKKPTLITVERCLGVRPRREGGGRSRL